MEQKKVEHFQLEVRFGVQLHDTKEGTSHTGTTTRLKRGVNRRGRWPNKAQFHSDCGKTITETIPCVCEHNPLIECPTCSKLTEA